MQLQNMYAFSESLLGIIKKYIGSLTWSTLNALCVTLCVCGGEGRGFSTLSISYCCRRYLLLNSNLVILLTYN